MSDIVKRLNRAELYTSGGEVSDLPEEAADTITHLTAEVEKLKADFAFADAQCAKVGDLFLGASKENEKLRSMLMDVVECWDWWQEDTEDHCLSVPRGAVEAARTEIFGGKK
jgi:hypothetical protein